MSDMRVDADRFGATLEQLLDQVGENAREGLVRATRKAAQKGRRAVIRNIPKAGIKKREGERYLHGWSYRIRRTPDGPTATIGNRDVPGLAHLLEKGHARVGGGTVPAYPHIAEAADETFEKFIEEARKELGNL